MRPRASNTVRRRPWCCVELGSALWREHGEFILLLKQEQHGGRVGEHLVFVRIAFQEKIFVIASVISSCNQSGVITLDIFGPLDQELEKPCHVDVSIRGLGMRNCGWKWGVADLNWARCPMDRICEQRGCDC